MFATLSLNTAYGSNWLFCADDEAHDLRNRGKKFWSAFFIHERSEFTVSMTATPCITRPQDLWNLGRCMRLEGFGSDHDGEADDMERELRSAAGKDRRDMKKNGKSNAANMPTAQVEAATVVGMAYHEKMMKWICVIRQKFTGNVIRRTLQSKDNEGRPISRLDPYVENKIVIKLYPHEMANLDDLAKDMVQDGTQRAAHMAKGSVGFPFPSTTKLI
jgi:hypothetical protein